jgi:hypothetical protein
MENNYAQASVKSTMVYNVNDTATQVLAAKQVKENIFMDLVHKNGYGVTQHEETNASSIRIFKVKPSGNTSRQLGANTNGGWFSGSTVKTPEVVEYDLNLTYVYDTPIDIPEVQQDMVSVNLMDNTTKNIGGEVATDINASTLAVQLVAGASNKVDYTSGKAYEAIMAASNKLDEGDEANGIQSFPFAEREIIMRPSFRAALLGDKSLLIGGSNYAQSMLAKGAVSPEAQKEWGNMYCGEIDRVPCYIAPPILWKKAADWTSSATAFDEVQALVCAASATDRGISTQDYIKIIESPNGAGKRLQPKTRWGINVAYNKGIVPIVTSGESITATFGTAPGSKASS